MLKMTRLALPLIVAIAACGDGPSTVPTSAPAGRPSYDKGGESGSDGIADIAAALNAAWAAKDAAGYAAPFAEDGNIISPMGTVLAGRPAIEARHALLFAGPLLNSTQIITFQRVQMLSGTIAIVDGTAVLTNGSSVTHTLLRLVVAKNDGVWQIEAAQSTPTA